MRGERTNTGRVVLPRGLRLRAQRHVALAVLVAAKQGAETGRLDGDSKTKSE